MPETEGGGQPRFVYLIGRVDRGLRKGLAEALREFELSLSEYTAMSVLARRPGLSNAQLARRSLIAPQSMIDVLARLERRGLVSRGVDPSHGRIYPAHLTGHGEELLGRADAAVAALEDDLLSALSARERGALRKGLTTIVRRLRDGR